MPIMGKECCVSCGSLLCLFLTLHYILYTKGIRNKNLLCKEQVQVRNGVRNFQFFVVEWFKALLSCRWNGWGIIAICKYGVHFGFEGILNSSCDGSKW
jgi:hypothetical protein